MATRRNTGFYIDAPHPIDGRMRVSTYTDLNAIPVKYDRMVTHVVDEDKDYRYYGSTNTWVPLTYSGDASWGTITGDINAQTDLINKFSNYALANHTHPQQPPLAHSHVTGDILDDGSGNVVWNRNLVAPDFILVGSSDSLEDVIDRTWILTDGVNTSDIASNTTVLFSGFEFDKVNKVLTYEETDPTVPNYVKAISTTDIARWNSSYNALIYKADILYVDEQDEALDQRIDALENPNRVVKYGEITFSGMNILIAAKEFEWVAGGVYTSDSPAVGMGELVMTPCDPGKYRYVLLQGNSNGTYSIREGLQSSTVAEVPTPDVGAVALATIHIFESTVLGNEDVLSDLDEKLNLKEDKINKQDSLEADGTGVKYPTVDAVIQGDQDVLEQSMAYTDSVSQELVEDRHYVHDQSIPSNLWTIVHNLNKIPSVVVVDSAGTTVEGSVMYSPDNPLNELSITFNGSFSGKGFLN